MIDCIDICGHSPFAVDIIFLMALAVTASDLAALTVVQPKNFTVNISRSENPFSPPSSSKFSDKSLSVDANAQFSPTSA